MLHFGTDNMNFGIVKKSPVSNNESVNKEPHRRGAEIINETNF